MADQFAREKIFLIAGEVKSFAFDYSLHGGVRGGEVLTNPIFAFVDSGHGVTASGTAVLAADFLDFDTGRKVPSGKGAKVLLDGTGAVVPGIYTVSMKVAIGTDAGVKILGDLVVTDAGGAIP